MNLVIDNMQSLYEQTWGWDEQTKREELFNDPLSQYIFVYGRNDDIHPHFILGFAHFKFEFDDDGLIAFSLFLFFKLFPFLSW